MKKTLLSLIAASFLTANFASAATVIDNERLGITATFITGEIAGNSSQIGVNVKYTELLAGDENGFWTGAINLTATQDYQSISAPFAFNFYKNANEFLDIAGVNVYPFVNRIKNVSTSNKQNFGGIGLSTNLVLQYQGEKLADIEIGGEKSIFDKSTHKYANLFAKVNIPMHDNLSAYVQVGKVFLTDKTTKTTTEPTSTTQNTFLLGISYTF